VKQEIQNELHINARDLELIDLDFPECAELLKKYIDKNISASIELIELDLRWCVVIYSQAHIFLNSCLLHLATNTEKLKHMVILTTDNYVTRELTCYEFFRTTLAVHGNDHNPTSVTSAIDKYCKDKKLNIEVKVFSGDSEDPSAPELRSYVFQ